MRLLYIIAIVLSAVYPVVIVMLIDRIQSMMWFSLEEYLAWSFNGILIIELFNIFFILLFSFTFKYIKRTTSLVLSIIGLSLTGLVFLIVLMPLIDPMPFDVVAACAFIITPVLLAFSIVNLVQANIYAKKGKTPVNEKTIDDVV